MRASTLKPVPLVYHHVSTHNAVAVANATMSAIGFEPMRNPLSHSGKLTHAETSLAED